jgi:hypothetical protein
VDDILIYDQNKTNIDHTLNEFNKLQKAITFTIEKEKQESIHFLDINTSERQKFTKFNISKTHSDRYHNTKKFM